MTRHIVDRCRKQRGAALDRFQVGINPAGQTALPRGVIRKSPLGFRSTLNAPTPDISVRTLPANTVVAFLLLRRMIF